MIKNAVCISLAGVFFLAACASRGNTAGIATETPASKPAEAEKPVFVCMPLKSKAEPPAAPTSKTAGKAAEKTSAGTKKTSAKAAPPVKPAAEAAPVPAEPVSVGADGTCPPGTEKKEAAAPVPKTSPVDAAKATGAKATESADQPRMAKSVDGSFEGEIYGQPVPGCKLDKVKIGMFQPEVQNVAGQPNDVTHVNTFKAYIPFYMGPDATRFVLIYTGCGTVSVSPNAVGGGDKRPVVVEIRHDPKTR